MSHATNNENWKEEKKKWKKPKVTVRNYYETKGKSEYTLERDTFRLGQS